MKYKDQRIHKTIVKIFLLFFVFFLLLSHAFTTQTFAATKLKIKYSGKAINYQGKRAKVISDGKTIDMKGTPGILINGTSLVSYKDVFKNGLGASCQYNSSKKIITIKQFGNTVKLKLGSTTGTVNGKKEKFSIAPQKVKFYAAQSTKILVPTRFVAEALGYQYSWTENTATIAMTSPFSIYYDNSWKNYTTTKGKVIVNETPINLNTMPGIILDNTLLVPAKKVFANKSINASYQYKKAAKQVKLTKEKTEIVFTIDSKIATVNEKEYSLTTPARIIKNGKTNKSYFMVPAEFTAKWFGYDYQWDSSDSCAILTTNLDDGEDDDGEDNDSDDENNNEISSPGTYFTLETSQAMQQEVANSSSLSAKTRLSGNGSITGNLTISTTPLITTGIEKYTISSDNPLGVITGNYDANTISIICDNTKAENTTQTIKNTIINELQVINHSDTSSTEIQLKTAAKGIKYKMELSEDSRILSVFVYPNYLVKLSASKEEEKELVTLTGLSALTTQVTEDDTHIYIECRNTIDAIQGQFPDITDGFYLKKVSIENLANGSIQVIIQKTKSSDYTMDVSENKTTFTLSKEIQGNGGNDVTPDPDVPNDNQTTNQLKILKPDGIKLSAVKDEDRYLSKQFVITIPGNQVNFYQKNPIVSNINSISNISIKLNTSGNTDIIITTKIIQGYKITESGNYFVVLVDSPSKIYKNIVVLDPGHGGGASGAVNGSITEKSINLQILYNKGKDHFNAKDSTVKAYWTRIADNDVDLFDRAAFAQEVEADIFISLHMNSFNGSASGFETWYAAENNKENKTGLSSSKLASYLNKKLTSSLEVSSNRGVKYKALIVCKYNTVPATLIELGFIDNKTDIARLTNQTYQEQAASAIYEATKEIFELYPTGR